MNTESEAQVLIVGANPIGLTTGILLTLNGIPCRIIDKNNRIPSKEYFSRALGLHARTLEVFEDIGVIKNIMTKGRIINGIGFYVEGRRVTGVSFRELPTSYPFMLSIPQSDTESILEARLNELGVFVERQTELVDIVQSDLFVTAQIRLPDGFLQTQAYAFVVGTDGFRSKVRDLCNIPFDGSEYEESWLLAESYLSRDFPSDEANVVISKNSCFAVVPMPDGKTRVTGPDTSSMKDVDEVDLTLFDTALKEMGALANISYTDPEQVTRFRVHKRLARHYAKHRVFLAGDAAHVHSPGGGQGLNTGVLDAYNLVWRLNLVIKEQATFALMDDYEVERRHAGEVTVFGTDKAMQMLRSNRSAMSKSITNLVLPWLMKSNFGKQLAANMSQIFNHYRHNYTEQEQEYYNCSIQLGDPLLRVVPPIDVAGDPLKIQPNGKFTFLVFSAHMKKEALAVELKKLVAVAKNYQNFFRIILIADAPMQSIPDVELVFDKSRYIHNAFGMNEPGAYVCRPDGIIASRTKNANFEHVFDTFIQKSLRLRTNESSAMRASA
ncbi:FAD-dependent monooxygenase [Pseudoalteromonas xiamenensis]